MRPSVELFNLGEVEYNQGLALQERLFGELTAAVERRRGGVAEKGGRGCSKEKGECAGWLILCSHPHVYTLGRSGRAENLLVDEAELRRRGAALHRIGRGGDITYHGPGQIVGYPLLDLEAVGLSLRAYVEALETSVIETVGAFGIAAGRVEGKTGVWITGATALAGETPRKICAIGVKASRGVVMHGFALNVATDLGWFSLINPCGMVGGGVTSVERELGRKVDDHAVKEVLCERLEENLGIGLND